MSVNCIKQGYKTCSDSVAEIHKHIKTIFETRGEIWKKSKFADSLVDWTGVDYVPVIINGK